MSTKHLSEPATAKVDRIKANVDKLAACAALLPQAMAFTYTVERFMRAGDGSDPRVPPTEGEVADAMYALRAAIVKAAGE